MARQITVAHGDTLIHVRRSTRDVDDKHPLSKPHFVVQDDRGGAARWVPEDSPEGSRLQQLHPELENLEAAPVDEEDDVDDDDDDDDDRRRGWHS